MKKDFQIFAGIAILAAAIAMHEPSTAAADAPQPASGDFVVEAVMPTSVQPVGEIALIELTAEFHLAGTLDGVFIAEFLIVHFGSLGEPADEHFIAHGTFEGEVDGAVGSFDFVFEGDITADGFAEGDLVIGRGFDSLAGLSGRITLSGLAGVAGDYEGSIHFAP